MLNWNPENLDNHMVTDEQPAEIFTKGYQVAGPKFYDLYIILGVSTQSHAYSIRRIMRKKKTQYLSDRHVG